MILVRDNIVLPRNGRAEWEGTGGRLDADENSQECVAPEVREGQRPHLPGGASARRVGL